MIYKIYDEKGEVINTIIASSSEFVEQNYKGCRYEDITPPEPPEPKLESVEPVAPPEYATKQDIEDLKALIISLGGIK